MRNSKKIIEIILVQTSLYALNNPLALVNISIISLLINSYFENILFTTLKLLNFLCLIFEFQSFPYIILFLINGFKLIKKLNIILVECYFSYFLNVLLSNLHRTS